MQFNIEINNQQVSAKRGETIKNVLDRIGIRVPTLCFMSGFTPSGGCRMCVVEVEGLAGLVPACSHPVSEWMKIKTHSTRVLKARRSLVELLLASHPDDCLYCKRNGNCQLQDLAGEMNVSERKYHGMRERIAIDNTCSSITRDPSKCILCGRCIRVCNEVIGVSAIDIVGRGSDSRIGTSANKGLNMQTCVKCGQCIMVCPTAALSEKSNINTVLEALSNPDCYPVIQFSPTVASAVAEEFNVKSSKDILNLFKAALKRMGFRQVYDAAMASDVNIMEEAAMFIERLNNGGPLPLLTSSCPSWVRYIEEMHPDLLPKLSSLRPPQQIMGRIIKHYITGSAGLKPENVFIISVSPCTANKHEAFTDKGKDNTYQYIDTAITTRELISIIRLLGLDLNELEPEPADSSFSMRSSSGVLSGISGGHLEGLLRTINFMMTGQELSPSKVVELRGLKNRKEARIRIGKSVIPVVAVNGLAQIKAVLDDVEAGKSDYKIIEVMACPNGCINGGGQKLSQDEKNLKSRMKILYDTDEEEMIRVAHKNPIISEMYDKFLTTPCSAHNRELLHVSRTVKSSQ